MRYKEVKDFVIEKLRNELKPGLYYHNYKHTLDLCDCVEYLAKGENIQGEDLMLLRTAAVFHDTGFLWQYDNNEPLGCKFAKELLPDYDYSDEQIEKVCDMIMATQMPQNPKNKLAEIICDADLFYIGRDDFFITALRLHREWSENSAMKITFKDWYLKQKSFVLSHEFFTESARKLLNEKKTHNLSQIKELLALLEATFGEKTA